MKQLFLFSVALIIAFEAFSQDTIYGTPTKIDLNQLETYPFYAGAGCAHGHICCQAGCHCCTELKRKQIYDSIFHPSQNGTQRITIVERYFYASSHERSSVHYRFKKLVSRSDNADKEKSELSEKWYRADLRQYWAYENDGLERYPTDLEKRYQETNSALVIDSKGDYHLIDLEGKILPMKFHSHRAVGDGIFISGIIVNDLIIYGFSDGVSTKIGPMNYSDIKPFDEKGQAIALNTNGQYGIVNKLGEVVVPFLYDYISYLGEDRFLAQIGGNKFLIDRKGQGLTDAKYNFINTFSEGLAFARSGENRMVYIDTTGEEVIHKNIDWGYDFHDGIAAVCKDKKWGYIDRMGKLVIDYQFYAARDFHNGVAPVSLGDNSNTDRWGLIDKTGKFITSKEYSEIELFKNGLARTFINGKGYGFINTKGKVEFDCIYNFHGYGSKDDWFIHDKMIRTTIGQQKSLELIDRNGKQLLDLSAYTYAHFPQDPKLPNSFLPYLMVQDIFGKSNLIDMKGDSLFKHNYERFSIITADLAIGQKDNRWYIISIPTGEELSELKNGNVVSIFDGVLKLQSDINNYQYEYYDLEGNKIEVYGVGF